jgi:hypothetical protein
MRVALEQAERVRESVGWLVAGHVVGVVGFFYLLILCLPVPFAYFAFNRYDEEGNEKADL